jgi:hypothetical protein
MTAPSAIQSALLVWRPSAVRDAFEERLLAVCETVRCCDDPVGAYVSLRTSPASLIFVDCSGRQARATVFVRELLSADIVRDRPPTVVLVYPDDAPIDLAAAEACGAAGAVWARASAPHLARWVAGETPAPKDDAAVTLTQDPDAPLPTQAAGTVVSRRLLDALTSFEAWTRSGDDRLLQRSVEALDIAAQMALLTGDRDVLHAVNQLFVEFDRVSKSWDGDHRGMQSEIVKAARLADRSRR